MSALSAEQYLKLSRKETLDCPKESKVKHVPESHDSLMRVVEERLGIPAIPNDLIPGKEWTANLVRWFAHIRQHFAKETAKTGEVRGRFGEIGKRSPRPGEIGSGAEAIEVMSVMVKRRDQLSAIDLEWAFGALVVLDRLLAPEMCVVVQDFRDRVLVELQGVDRNDKKMPRMIVIVTLISRYFNQ